MDTIELAAAKRTDTGKQNKALRAAGSVPAVLYGRGLDSQAIEVSSKEIERVYHQVGTSKIVGLKVGSAKVRNVLVHEVQFGAVKGEIRHVDFYALRMDEELTTEIPLRFTGESTAVYQDEGTLIKQLEAVEVTCLPGDLPESIDVDISVLDDFEKTLTLADLVVPKGVKLTAEDTSELVAKVEPPRTEEEMAQLDETVTEALPEAVQEETPVVSEENGGSRDR